MEKSPYTLQKWDYIKNELEQIDKHLKKPSYFKSLTCSSISSLNILEENKYKKRMWGFMMKKPPAVKGFS